MIKYNSVIALHTRKDEGNLAEIADYLQIPPKERAVVHIRNLMPPSFTEFKKEEAENIKVPEFIETAVSKGKIIAGVLERLDLIKMDPVVLENFRDFIIEMAKSEDGQNLLKNLRIAWISRPANFPEGWKMREIYSVYNERVDELIKEINQTFRQVMIEIGEEQEDFILAYRNDQGSLSGYPHDRLKSEFYPHVNIMFQLGQEGLCQTVQEGMITTAFGLDTPRPAVAVVSSMVGFAEKARDAHLDNVIIVDNPVNIEQFVQGFKNAYDLARQIRDNPTSQGIADIIKSMEAYYDKCGDSFYAEEIRKLVESRQARV